MQAIARVNRVFNGKVGGLVVDYIGIAKALKEAMRDYTGRDRKNFGTQTSKAWLLQSLKRSWKCAKTYFMAIIIVSSTQGQMLTALN